MEHKGPRPATNIAFVIILTLALIGALDFSYRITMYALNGTV